MEARRECGVMRRRVCVQRMRWHGVEDGSGGTLECGRHCGGDDGAVAHRRKCGAWRSCARAQLGWRWCVGRRRRKGMHGRGASAKARGGKRRRRDGWRSEAARAACGGACGRRKSADGGGGDSGGEGEGSSKNTSESEWVVSRQERNMTCGPRSFSYRRLIRRLGFEHRLIASV
jgi:hypothetical protein